MNALNACNLLLGWCHDCCPRAVQTSTILIVADSSLWRTRSGAGILDGMPCVLSRKGWEPRQTAIGALVEWQVNDWHRKRVQSGCAIDNE